MTVLVRTEMTLVDDSRTEFTGTAEALAAAADEPGTLPYMWYRTDDPDRFVVIEEYADGAAAFAHNENVAELLHRMSTLTEISLLQLHGDLTPERDPDLDRLRRTGTLPQPHPRPGALAARSSTSGAKAGLVVIAG